MFRQPQVPYPALSSAAPADKKASVLTGSYESARVSLIGNRSEQQDAEGAWHSPQASLAVVADGAGGHQGSAQASALAVEVLQGCWEQELKQGVTPEQAADILMQAIADAHARILEQGNGKASLCGKSAIVILYLCGGSYTVLNVGDCRAYLGGAGGWELLTKDDSLLQVELDAGMITPEEAVDHPDQGILTQALGSHKTPKPHLKQGFCGADNDFLLCCDGLWNQLPADWSSAPWATEPTNEAHQALLQAKAELAVAQRHGSSDNVSAVWVYAAPQTTQGEAGACRLGKSILFLSRGLHIAAWVGVPAFVAVSMGHEPSSLTDTSFAAATGLWVLTAFLYLIAFFAHAARHDKVRFIAGMVTASAVCLLSALFIAMELPIYPAAGWQAGLILLLIALLSLACCSRAVPFEPARRCAMRFILGMAAELILLASAVWLCIFLPVAPYSPLF